MQPSLLEQLKEFIGDCLIFALGFIVFVHLILFLFFGWILIGEPNRIILGIEMAMAVVVMVLAVDRAKGDIPRK